MKLINLVENTPGAPLCRSAHGLSFYIETRSHRLLMDAGPGPVLAENADALGVDLTQVDTVVLSHGHYDHADGLPALARRNPHASIYLHRGAEQPRYSLDPGGYRYNGMDPAIPALPNLVWTQGRVDLDEELSLFDGAAHERFWPQSNRRLFCKRAGEMVQDPFDHEQYLVVRDGSRRFLLSGCAHQGVVNILERFRALYGGEPDAVVSGFHMMKRSGHYTGEDWDLIRGTALWLKEHYGGELFTCHCTGLEPYQEMKSVLGQQLHYVHCGEALDM